MTNFIFTLNTLLW